MGLSGTSILEKVSLRRLVASTAIPGGGFGSSSACQTFQGLSLATLANERLDYRGLWPVSSCVQNDHSSAGWTGWSSVLHLNCGDPSSTVHRSRLGPITALQCFLLHGFILLVYGISSEMLLPLLKTRTVICDCLSEEMLLL